MPYDDSNDSSATFQPPMADPERNRLSNKLDVWCLDLRKNILVRELADWRGVATFQGFAESF